MTDSYAPLLKPNQNGKPVGTLRELWQHRQLLWQFTVRNLELRHKGSLLGMTWTVANPLLALIVYVTVFGYIFGGHFREDPIHTKGSYAMGIFLGLTFFHFIAEVIAVAPGAILTSPNLVKKVRFPLAILPAAATGASFIHFLISLLLCGISAQWLGIPIGNKLGWLIVLLPPLGLIGLGIGILLSAVGVYVRDVGQMTPFVNLILLYASAIFFSVHSIPEPIWRFLRFNPLLQMVNETRQILIWDLPPNFLHIGYTYLAGLVTVAFGCWCFRALRQSFSDAI